MRAQWCSPRPAPDCDATCGCSIALIVTIFVSLTLVGMGLLLNAQADKAEKFWGSKLQDGRPDVQPERRGVNCHRCVDGRAEGGDHGDASTRTPRWRRTTTRARTRRSTPGSASTSTEDKSEQGDLLHGHCCGHAGVLLGQSSRTPTSTAASRPHSSNTQGVAAVRDLRQVLKPIYFWITVMKWGAISIAAFLLVAAILQAGRRQRGRRLRPPQGDRHHAAGRGLQPLHLAAVPDGDPRRCPGGHRPVVPGRARVHANSSSTASSADSNIVEWVDWQDAFVAIGGIATIGVLLTLIPTLVMTRKYLEGDVGRLRSSGSLSPY